MNAIEIQEWARKLHVAQQPGCAQLTIDEIERALLEASRAGFGQQVHISAAGPPGRRSVVGLVFYRFNAGIRTEGSELHAWTHVRKKADVRVWWASWVPWDVKAAWACGLLGASGAEAAA